MSRALHERISNCELTERIRSGAIRCATKQQRSSVEVCQVSERQVGVASFERHSLSSFSVRMATRRSKVGAAPVRPVAPLERFARLMSFNLRTAARRCRKRRVSSRTALVHLCLPSPPRLHYSRHTAPLRSDATRCDAILRDTRRYDAIIAIRTYLSAF